MAPDSPFGGQAVPKAGGRNLCSIERSRGHFSGCRSGNSQCAPVFSWNTSRRPEGRSFGSRSTPQPRMRARSASLDSAIGGLCGVYAMAGLLSGRARDDQRLDAAVQLGGEDVVTLGDVLEGEAVRDDFARLEVAVAHVLEQ